MKGKVNCLFAGGPQGDEALTLAAIHCREQLSLEQDLWIKAGAGGAATVVKGRRPERADWLSYTTAVYEKTRRDREGRLVYEFQRLETVQRCSHVLEAKGRLCKHPALSGQSYCRQHSPTDEKYHY
ncbi:CCCH zinc finger protein [Trinickia dinghuensis]|uniref:Zinc finger CCCH-type TRM13 domain-containing protein n=1 Tax=Trinickia dinghuensis TaxID=2291023 RepID=A0A3D8JQE9_9BURK|nr:CCCH zinc finger protein [Trinickia dinghuensis]RDU95257.1 hypothetical protein DWV00_30195 [Trinickia dinghuensis]